MNARVLALACGVAVLLGSLGEAAAARLYRWKDKQGYTQYGDQPPPPDPQADAAWLAWLAPLFAQFGAAPPDALAEIAASKGLTGRSYAELVRTPEVREVVGACVEQLNAGNHALAVEMARIPEQIKGFGHVKARHLAAARQKWEGLKAQWSAQN